MNKTRRFEFREAPELIAELASVYELHHDGRGAVTCSEPATGSAPATPRYRFVPPACLPPLTANTGISEWAELAATGPGREWIVLLQAGAAALGCYDADEECATKVFKRYVVRGNGKAQATHLKTRGKSRYGSRLRLQMADKLLAETSERLRTWHDEFGTPDLVHRGCVDPLWMAFHGQQQQPPPFAHDAPEVRRIALDVHVPGLDELRRVRRELRRGHLIALSPA